MAISAEDREELDRAIFALSQISESFTLDDFREAQIVAAHRTKQRIRAYILGFGALFLTTCFFDLFLASRTNDLVISPSSQAIPESHYTFVYGAIWAAALGGLGAVASIFLDILKLIPENTLKKSDEFEVFGRILLGVLFSFVLSSTLLSDELNTFFSKLATGQLSKDGSNLKLLLPFLAGYSLPLVLGLLDKAIRAIELTIGVDDRRSDPPNSRSRSSRKRS
jgi:hypothetical protein